MLTARTAGLVGLGATILFLGHFVLAGGFHGVPIKTMLLELLHLVQRLGWKGQPVLGLMLMVAIVLCLPTTAFNIGGGFLYGWPFLPLLCVCAIGGACLAFLVGRTIVAPFARSRLEGNDMYEALNTFFEQDSGKFSVRSLKLVLLLRASPMFPFAIINYSCGVSKLAFSTYAVGTAIGMLPWLVIDVYFGTVLTDLAEIGKVRSVPYVAGIAGFTVVVTAYITVKARGFLKGYRRRLGKKRDSDSGPALLTPIHEVDEGSLRFSYAPVVLA